MASSADDPKSKDDYAATKVAQSPMLAPILKELNVNEDQLIKRQRIIKDIENELTKRHKVPNRMISYVFRFGHPKSMIHSDDITALETVLKSISDAQQLNVLINSPGGDGSIVEKMVEMCRNHLSYRNTKLRVIVPNIAKSAATLFALGSDTITMGYCSELGPIDPQVVIAVSGHTKYISAFAFVESRDTLMIQISEAIKKNEPTVGLLQQLAGLNIPFTHEMENLIDFSEKTAIRLLDKYMLKAKIKNDTKRLEKAKEIAKKLLSKQLFPIHGHFINAATAKKDLELEVEILERKDKLWELIWEYYIRAEIQMNIQTQPNLMKIKLFKMSNKSFVGQASFSLGAGTEN